MNKDELFWLCTVTWESFAKKPWLVIKAFSSKEQQGHFSEQPCYWEACIIVYMIAIITSQQSIGKEKWDFHIKATLGNDMGQETCQFISMVHIFIK